MNLLLIADTHDVTAHIERLFAQISGVDAILHAGDLAHPDTFGVLAAARVPVYYVIGNNEDDPEAIALAAKQYGIHFLGEQGEVTLDGRRIAMTHYPRVATSLAVFGGFDVILYGHSHHARKERLTHGGWLVNPGNLAGFREEATYALYDTRSHEVTHHRLQTRQRSWSFT